jgi:hypothetical protein
MLSLCSCGNVLVVKDGGGQVDGVQALTCSRLSFTVQSQSVKPRMHPSQLRCHLSRCNTLRGDITAHHSRVLITHSHLKITATY